MAAAKAGVALATVQVPTAAASKYFSSDLQAVKAWCCRGAMLTSTSAIERCSSMKSMKGTTSIRSRPSSASSPSDVEAAHHPEAHVGVALEQAGQGGRGDREVVARASACR